MIKKLRKRFILFNMIVILVVFVMFGLIIWLTNDESTVHEVHQDHQGHMNSEMRLIFTGVIFLIMAFVASLFLAKVAIEPIKNAWKKQLDFTADASHELRTPLAVIQTSLEIVLDNEEETVASQKEWLTNIAIEQRRMASLVEDLLTLARGDTGTQVLEVMPIDLSEIISEVQQSFSPIAAKKEITIGCSKMEDATMQGDRKRIKQLIIILVDNAIKYMGRAGSIQINVEKVAIGLKRKKMLLVKVSDTGCGIPSDKLPHLFERFYRADPSRTEEGSGLGLSIAKWITESHDGTIKVKSTVGEGTTFTILLPCERKR